MPVDVEFLLEQGKSVAQVLFGVAVLCFHHLGDFEQFVLRLRRFGEVVVGWFDHCVLHFDPEGGKVSAVRGIEKHLLLDRSFGDVLLRADEQLVQQVGALSRVVVDRGL